jgi:hypothetical protein
MDGERTIAAKTRPRKRAATEVAAAAEMHTAAEVVSTATEMPAAKVPAAMAATVKMPSTAVTATVAASTVAASTVAPAAMAPAATFRNGIARSRQRGCKNKDGNSNLEF